MVDDLIVEDLEYSKTELLSGRVVEQRQSVKVSKRKKKKNKRTKPEDNQHQRGESEPNHIVLLTRYQTSNEVVKAKSLQPFTGQAPNTKRSLLKRQ